MGWSYGCLIYQLLTKRCPFRTSACKDFYLEKNGRKADSSKDAYNTATCEMELIYSNEIFNRHRYLEDFFKGLFSRDPEKRLGGSSDEDDELFKRLKSHKFFSSWDWGM